MHQVIEKRKITRHIICMLCACLVCCAGVIFMRYLMADTIPSEYYEDIVMPEECTSILDITSIRTLNSERKGRHIYAGEHDAQLIFEFNDQKKVKVRSVEVRLEESFPYDVLCSLFYPNPDGKYKEECKETFTLPKGRTSAYFEIPDDVRYSMACLRVDIDEDYILEDVLISEEPISSEYRPKEHYPIGFALIHFLIWFAVFEALMHYMPYIRRFACRFWRKEVKALLILLLGAAVVGNAASYTVVRLMGKEYSWFWAELVGVCSMVTAYELYLLWRKQPLRTTNKKSGIAKQALFWGLILGFCLFIVFEWIDSSGSAPELGDKFRFQIPLLFAGIETILLALLYQKYILHTQESSISYLHVYLFLFFMTGLAYMVIFLPFVSPDEPSHYLSAYRVSNILLGEAGQPGDPRLLMRMEDFALYEQRKLTLNSEYYMEFTEGIRLFAQEQGFAIADGPMVTNAIFGYLIPGLGITAARLLHLSGSMTFWAGRFANLLFFTFVLRYLMKKIPFAGTALFAVAMMPMTLHTVASCSYDVTTICFVALFVVQVMDMVRAEEKVSAADYMRCVAYGFLMAPSKMVYIPLLFLVLLIPDKNLGENRKQAWKKKLLVIGGSIAFAVVIMVLVNVVSADSAIRKMVRENTTVTMLSWIHEPGYTISWVIGHPGEYFMMCIRTVISMTDYYFFTMIGSQLGWLDVVIPQICTVISLVIFLLAVNIWRTAADPLQLSGGRKLWILLLCAGTVFCTMLVMTLSWTPVSYDHIVGVQGRYFIPLLIPAIWLFRNRMVSVDGAIQKYIVFFATLLNVWTLVYIFAQYIVRA